MAWIKLFSFHILIFLMFYYYVLSPIKYEINDALLVEKQARQVLRKKQKSYTLSINKSHQEIKIIPVTKTDLMKYFINKIVASNFVVEAIYPVQVQKHGNVVKISFKVVLSGGIYQLKNLMDQLSEARFLINMDEIVVNHVKKSTIKMVMKLDIFNISDVSASVFSARPYVLQWIGCTEINGNIKAFLRLDNGDVRVVIVGSVINKTIKIVKITKEQMLVQAGKREGIIKYGQVLEI